MISRDMVGADGKVRVFDTVDKVWKRAFPVDVREQMARGTISLSGPTVTMVGPAGEVAVFADDVTRRMQEGYRLKSPEDAKVVEGFAVANKQLPTPTTIPTTQGDRPGDAPAADPDADLSGAQNPTSEPANNEPPSPDVYDFTVHSDAELANMVSQAQLNIPGRATRAKMLAALDGSNWRPTR